MRIARSIVFSFLDLDPHDREIGMRSNILLPIVVDRKVMMLCQFILFYFYFNSFWGGVSNI